MFNDKGRKEEKIWRGLESNILELVLSNRCYSRDVRKYWFGFSKYSFSFKFIYRYIKFNEV